MFCTPSLLNLSLCHLSDLTLPYIVLCPSHIGFLVLPTVPACLRTLYLLPPPQLYMALSLTSFKFLLNVFLGDMKNDILYFEERC